MKSLFVGNYLSNILVVYFLNLWLNLTVFFLCSFNIRVQRLMHELESARRADVREGVIASGGDPVDAYMSAAMQNIWHEESHSIAEHLLKSWKEDTQLKALDSRIRYSDCLRISSNAGVSESTHSADPATKAVPVPVETERNVFLGGNKKVGEADVARDSSASSCVRGSSEKVSNTSTTPAEAALDVYRKYLDKSESSTNNDSDTNSNCNGSPTTFRKERLLEVLTEDIFEIYLVGFATTAAEESKNKLSPGEEEIDNDIKKKQEQLALMLSDRYGVHYDGYSLPNKPLEVAGTSFFSSRAVMTIVVGFLAFLLMQYSGVYS